MEPFTAFTPQPLQGDVPVVFPNPFNEGSVHPLAARAASELQRELREGMLDPLIADQLEHVGGGKMFGVLVARSPDGVIGVLRGFSGVLANAWEVANFVPPMFDAVRRAAVEVPGERFIKRLTAKVEAVREASRVDQLRAQLGLLINEQRAEVIALTELHRRRREARHAARASVDAATLEALAQESRGDKAARRELDQRHLSARTAAEAEFSTRSEAQVARWERRRGLASRALMKRIHDCYLVPNARGERRPLRSLFTTGEPPSGAGDCAGPKLLAYALTHGLTPLALAEFWWGAPPASGGRARGAFSPACAPKCGPLLPFMLEGLDVEPARRFDDARTSPAALRVLFEDEWLIALDKPEGLLSVPGKGDAPSVLEWLRARLLHATGPLLVRRLDLDTSGVLLAAKSDEVHRALQAQFIGRDVEKAYVAVLEGEVRGEEGVIELPLRVDLEDRPRQLVDAVHGKPAVTKWQVLERRDGTTRVRLLPLTGRTHQLRVHCAHAEGLGAPIVGDRLYGHSGPRLLLHAASLRLRHPVTQQPLVIESPAPF